LTLRRKKRKRLARERVPLRPAQAANQEWAMDFVTDAMACGRHLRVLTVVDVFTRECLALEADTSIGGLRVTRVLEAIIAERGQPKRIRSDNGPEFTSRAYLAWTVGKKIEPVHIRPGKPIENAYIESFNGRLRENVISGCSSFSEWRGSESRTLASSIP
jgi:putative transposase